MSERGPTCQAGPEFEHKQHTAAHPPWRSGSSARLPTSLYSAHSLAELWRDSEIKDG